MCGRLVHTAGALEALSFQRVVLESFGFGGTRSDSETDLEHSLF